MLTRSRLVMYLSVSCSTARGDEIIVRVDHLPTGVVPSRLPVIGEDIILSFAAEVKACALKTQRVQARKPVLGTLVFA